MSRQNIQLTNNREMTAKVISKVIDRAIIEWSDKSESGQISIVYDEKGRYIVNAEYIGIDRLLEILSKIKL